MSDSEFEWPRDMIPMDELELRYTIMEKIRQGQRFVRRTTDWNFSRLQLSVLKLLPLDDLQRTDIVCIYTFRLFFDDMNKFVYNFLPKDRVFSDTASSTVTSKWPQEDSAPVSNNDSQQGPNKSGSEEKIDRSCTERANCLALDNYLCVVTKTADPHVCHIIPFAWNDREPNRRRTESLSALMSALFVGFGQEVNALGALIKLFSGLGTSDKPFNMVAMTPTLHELWKKGCFALKWFATSPSDHPGLTDIKLQFIWMPWSPVRDATQVALLEDEKDEKKCLLSGLNHFCGPQGPPSGCDPNCKHCAKVNTVPGIVHPHTARPIESGTIIFVTRPSDMVEDFKVMIDLQYVLIRAAAISGAAQAPELLAPGTDEGVELRNRIRD
ncbi:hypothetical protein FDECE_8827 [Fusarium decemcellulare]|nr:hypothetical protein FDECE_8827 [Fusarium decemcellulare]